MSELVLVTGAPGWLGNRLVQALSSAGRPTRCLVLPGSDTRYLEECGADIVEGDVTAPGTLVPALAEVDTVFHAAGIIHAPMFSLGELDRVNAQGTRNVLDASIAAGVRRFVYVSSNSACGCNRRRDVLMDEATPERPYMAYGRSKRDAELAVSAASERGVIETAILRPCWYYGPGQPERQTRLMKMIIAGKAPLFGDGLNLRSMTSIDTLCDALIRASESDVARGQTYWIADERPYTTLEVYQTLAELLEVDLRVSRFPAFTSAGAALVDGMLQALGVYQMEIHVAGEMYKDIACSVEKARSELGWQPPSDLREGMTASIAWAREAGLL